MIVATSMFSPLGSMLHSRLPIHVLLQGRVPGEWAPGGAPQVLLTSSIDASQFNAAVPVFIPYG
jgi:hypothetical protein